MQLKLQQRHLLYLLTAILLLMQSFAIWHDVDHPFHIAEQQCEHFEAFNHSPTLDIPTQALPVFNAQFSIVQTTPSATYVPNQQRDAYAIRAPPIFS